MNNNLYQKKCAIFNSLFEENSIKDIVNVAQNHLNNPIFILDTSYHVISRSSLAENENSSMEIYNGECYLLSDIIDLMKKEKSINTIYTSNKAFFHNSTENLIFSPIKINDITSFYICILESKNKFSNDDLDITDTLSKVLSIKFDKENIFISNSGSNDEYYLMDLLSNDIDDIDYVHKRLQSTNFIMNSNYLFLCIPFEQKFNDYRHNFALKELVQHIKNILGNCIFTYYKDMLVFLLSNNTEDIITTSTKTKLLEFLELNNFQCSISFTFSNLLYLQDFFYQCIYAINLCKTLNHEKILILFEDYLDYYFFHISMNSKEHKLHLCTLIHPYIKKLIEYDKSNNTELINTLKEYIFNNRNANLTSNKLNIHRSTFFYRFHKIENIINAPLDANNTLFKLEISFKIQNYINLN